LQKGGAGQSHKVPELPEVESARAVIARSGLHRIIADVDDADTYECRPHAPGEIRAALLGRQLTEAHRRGKSMWCDTGADGPTLGIHLGMSGRILVTGSPTGEGGEDEGGDYVGFVGWASGASKQANFRSEWFRFTLTFEDGGQLRLFDKRRLGRVRLDPDLDALGPDAEEVGVAAFRERVGRGTAPVKARLLDQSVVAGIGNLLADEVLWQAEISPRAESGRLSAEELTTLHRELKKAIRSAIKKGGVHTGEVIPYRAKDQHCPRCGAEMRQGKVGGRTTWWCSAEQH
jgi:formamidopyrimidine-DNA glycosylase